MSASAAGNQGERIELQLRCGAVHEICGLCGGGEFSVGMLDSQGASVACPRDNDCRRTLAAIAPLGCILRMLQSWNASFPDGMSVSRHAPSSSGDQSDGHSSESLVRRGILWIGNRIHPDAHALWRLDSGVAERSVFLRDDLPHADSAAWRVAAHGLHQTAHRSSGGDAARSRMACRVWCAEQALRLGAAGVIVVDGAAFDMLAWRRLQLAVQQASADAACMPPIVLVLTPPDASGEATRRGCAAETRWTVHADLPGDGGSSCPFAVSCGSAASSASAAVPSWRMRLVSARSLGMTAVCRQKPGESGIHAGPGRAAGDHGAPHMRALLEQGALQCVVRDAPVVAGFEGVIGAAPRDAGAADFEQSAFRLPWLHLDADGPAPSALRARSA